MNRPTVETPGVDFLLIIGLLNSSVRGDTSNGPADWGAGGSTKAQLGKSDRSISSHGNFIPIGSPCPVLVGLKKMAFEPWSNSKPSASGLSGELTSNHR